MNRKIKIIGEAGLNHNGNYKTAMKLINIGKMAGVDYVKFQLFDTDEFINRDYKHKKIKYNFIFKRFKSLEFSVNKWKKLIKYGNKKGVKIFFSVFNLRSLKTLKKLNIRIIKIPSGEINNIPLLKEINKKKFSVILSTGMSSLKEISLAIKTLNSCKVELMHCVSEYPTKYPKLNTIKLLKKKFKKPVGYSDHTADTMTPALSVVAGAESIEKHFTYNKKQKIGDHKFSLSPLELKDMVNKVKQSEKSLGIETDKRISSKEKKLQFFARKGLYANKNLKKNQRLSLNDISILRPEGRTKVSDLKKILNRKLKIDINKNQSLDFSLLR